LHLAPEPAITSVFSSRPDLSYFSADLAMPSAAIHADINRMPFRAEAFAMLICSHLLEHIPEDAPALFEIARVLAKGASAFVMVPMLPEWESQSTKEFGAPKPRIDMHYRAYGADMKERIARAGLECRVAKFSEVASADEGFLYGIGDEVVFIGRKV
jgi:SAM-dependent methyltransferase